MKIVLDKKYMLLAFLWMLVKAGEAHENPPRDSTTAYRIWDNAKHNAFPDLLRFGNAFYCTVREGDSHVDNFNTGKVRVIRSRDGRHWESIALFEMPGVDVREARLSVTPSGKLMAILAAGVWKDGHYLSLSPFVSYSDPLGATFTPLERTVIDPAIAPGLDWIWRVTWHKGTGYGILYQMQAGERKGPWRAHLLRTKDGKHYEKVAELEVDGNPNESTIRFDAKGKMYVLVRREGGDQMGVLAESDYPYRHFTYTKLNQRLGGPNFLFLNNAHLIMGSRFHGPQAVSTALWVTDLKGHVQKAIQLPSGGDTSYPGMVLYQNILWVAYYSSHEGASKIYMAKVPLQQLQKD